jgi:hypothetical protein
VPARTPCHIGGENLQVEHVCARLRAPGGQHCGQ